MRGIKWGTRCRGSFLVTFVDEKKLEQGKGSNVLIGGKAVLNVDR